MEKHLKALLIALALLALYAAPVAAQDDENCADFGSRAEAQAHYNLDTSDPDNLDADSDGQACEAFDYGTGAGTDADQADTQDDQQAGDDQQTEMPSTGAGGLAGGARIPVGNAAAALTMLAAAGYAVLRRR